MIITGNLIYDDPEKTRTYELKEQNLVVHVIDRNDFDYITSNSRLVQHGLYMLFGNEPLHSRRKLYIGETQDLQQRLKQHIQHKEFWETAVTFSRLEEQLNKSQVKFLEHLAIKEAIEYGRVELMENCQIPKEPYLNSRDREEMIEFFELCKKVLKYAGYEVYLQKIFELDTEKSNSHNIISRVIKGYSGKKSNYNDNYERTDMVCEDVVDGYDSEENEDDLISYKLSNYANEFYAEALKLSDGKIMIMPHGHVSKKVKWSEIKEYIDVDACIDKNSRYLKKDIICDNLSVAALIITGSNDENQWKKVVHHIDLDY